MPVEPDPASLAARFARAVAGLSGQGNIALAVSGGGDSIAMMHLAARAVPPARLHVLTVDHGLRDDAATEIETVRKQAAALHLPHDVLTWAWDGQGNLQAAARVGRWAAMADWAAAHDVTSILLGHTEDDQVETLLMRLARGSGIDGLTAMARSDYRDGLRVLRPLLDVSRTDLRDWLRAEAISWCDDPSNDDPRFDRVRARQMFTQLETLGLTRKRLLQTIDHMQAAHRSLQQAAQGFARAHIRQDAGDLIFAPEALQLDAEDAPRRVMSAGFMWISGNVYRPRFERMMDVIAQARDGRTVTLGGCLLTPLSDGGLRMTREAAATPSVTRSADQLEASGVMWDRRWFIEGSLTPGLTFRALGDGLRDCPDWRAVDLPRMSLLASPAVWSGDRLIAAPVAGYFNGWTAQIVADFHEHAFAH